MKGWDMLKNTFVHIPGVGEETERRLWQAGILSWEDFLAASGHRKLPLFRRVEAGRWLEDSLLHEGDIDFFHRLLPGRHLWRLFDVFGRNAAYIDIETAGLPPERDYVTVIGLWSRGRLHQYVEGVNLPAFAEEVSRCSLLVTFNGACFDLPVLRRHFPSLRLDQPHIDLRHLLQRLGLRGGLKRIEVLCGISRPPEVRMLTGFDATLLWKRHLAGRAGGLELLLRYNREDCVNLERLMCQAYATLRDSLLGGRAASQTPAPLNLSYKRTA
ncbi:MAG: ribonuclease H-like domain-containing protein [Pseudomonadota bacterium]